MNNTPTGPSSTLAASAAAGFVAGFGLYVILRILGERLLAAPLVPLVWLIPLFGWAAAAGREGGGWRGRPGVTTLILVGLVAALADMAHVFYVPFASGTATSRFEPSHRHGAELLAFVLLVPSVLAVPGRRFGHAVASALVPLRAFAAGALGTGAGVVVGLVAVLALGGYEAFFVWACALATLLGSRRWLTVTVVVCVAAAAWVRVKPQGFFGAEGASAWTGRAWSGDAKLDRLAWGDCRGYAIDGVVLGQPCTGAPASASEAGGLAGELARRLRVESVLYLALAVPRAPATFLDASPLTERLIVVGADDRSMRWVGATGSGSDDGRWTDRRVSIAAGDARQALEGTTSVADLIFVDGVDVPFVASLFAPIPRSSWLFTREGHRALLGHLEPEGAIVVERSQATPEDFVRVLRAAPPEVKVVAAECRGTPIPDVELPCAWIGLTRSDATLAALRDAFLAAGTARLIDVPAVPPGRVPTDDHPIVIFPEKLYAVETGAALFVFAVVRLVRRRAAPSAQRKWRRALSLAGAGLALVQLAILTSLGRASAQPGITMALLLAVGWAGTAAMLWLGAAGPPPRRLAPVGAFRLAAAVAGSSLLASLLALAVASPFPNRALAIPFAALAVVPGAWGVARTWNRAPGDADRGELSAGVSAVLTGYALGFALLPGLVAADGFGLVVLAGAVASTGAAWLCGADAGAPADGLSRTGT